MNRDIVVIGGSAGSNEVLMELVRDLPADLPATLFVVIHTPAGHASPLPELLSNRGPLPASHPLHAEPFERGQIYVAPPDNHLLVRAGSMDVVRGPKENGHRPAVDALFRSAAATYGSRVIGVVLSGYHDCGTAGLMSIRARGGTSIVQAPDSARVPEMPRSVLARTSVDHVVAPVELASLLARLVAMPAGASLDPDPQIDRLEGRAPGAPAELVCPACDGVLTEATLGNFHQFRCHVGHVFTLRCLVQEQGEHIERALWAAVRALEEGGALSERLSATEPGELRARFAEKARTQRRQAEQIRQLLLRGHALSAEDAARA